MTHISYCNNCLNVNNSNYVEYQRQRFQKTFYEPFKQIFEEHVVPKYGNCGYTMDIQLGLWTSAEYGSYRISFKQQEKEFCYIIADIIIGEWKLYESAS